MPTGLSGGTDRREPGAIPAADEDRPGGAFLAADHLRVVGAWCERGDLDLPLAAVVGLVLPEQLVRSGALLEELDLPLLLACELAGLDPAVERRRVFRERDLGIDLDRLGTERRYGDHRERDERRGGQYGNATIGAGHLPLL